MSAWDLLSKTTVGAALFAFASLTSSPSQADSLTDTLGPREIATGDSMRGAASGAQSIVLNPSGLSVDRRLVFEASYGFRDVDNASVGRLSACDSTTPVSGCFYYHYFRAKPEVAGVKSLRRFHEFGVTASRAITPQISLGTNFHYFDYNSNLPSEEDKRGYAFDAGLTFKAIDALSVGVTGYNIIGSDSSQYPRGVGAGLALRPGQGVFGISADALWNLEIDEGSRGRYGGGLEYFLQAGGQSAAYPLRLGAVYNGISETTHMGFGVGYADAKVGIDISARKQVAGDGDELMVIGAIRMVAATSRQ